MKRIALMLALAAPAAATFAQTATAPKPASAKSATSKSATTAKSATGAHTAAGTASATKLPPGVPPARGLMKTAFALKYQDITIGTGALAEPNKLYEVHYTGWLASDGTKFDSSYDHRSPVLDKDGKPENDEKGEPKMGEAQPLTFPQGFGKLIPGWDQGFEGMHVGGKRRLFIPYQLAYGAMGRPPKIPAKSDLIFDVELMGVKDLPMRPGGPGMPGGMPNGRPMPMRPGMPGTPGAAPAPAPGTPPPSPTPSTTPKPVDPAQPNPATPAPTTVPAPAPPPAPNAAPNPPTTTTPDKPANPAQPNS